jgi:deazaflavin-dependent oxidoreductase (nitroreductase family)
MPTRTRLRSLGPITTRILNPVTRLFAGRLPGFGILTHTGRTTGRLYRTPLLVLRRGDHYVIGLWYGSDVHWVKNVLAAAGCEVRVSGRDVRLVEPDLFADPARRLLPLPLRLAGRLLRMSEFLRMRPAHAAVAGQPLVSPAGRLRMTPKPPHCCRSHSPR